MRTLTAGLTTHLGLRAFVPVDLYELVVGGTTYRYTTHGSNLTGVSPAPTSTFTAYTVRSGSQRASSGLEADDLEVIVDHGGTGSIGGKDWVTAALDGDLDGAAFTRYEGFVDTSTGLLAGCVVAFIGDVAEVEPASTYLRLVVSVPAKRFNTKFPTLVCAPNCVWDFGSTGCGYSGPMNFTATLAAGSTLSKIYLSALPGSLPGTGSIWHFDRGYATVGGLRRSVTVHSSAAYLVPAPPFPAGAVEAAIGSSGALGLHLGCDKTPDTCSSTGRGYLRIASYLGAPWAPRSTEAE